MRYEKVKIFTGEPDKVQDRTSRYLTGHPNARILSTAIAATSPPPSSPPDEGGSAGASAAKNAGDPGEPVITIMVTVATVFE